ncbi:MAG: DegT/DnrJ/EryC1/StrS family aminotransferase [bacterium]|nr:DegT/DnrJ/EryC1/StrS family aminotransferase [bacterium]
MKTPFVNYSLQYKNLEKEIDFAVKDVLTRGDLILRKDVEEFEENLAKFVGTKYAIGVNSCSDALIYSLMAAGVKRGDEVITVSHTFFATIEAIHHLGAEPVLVDVGEDFLMDADKIEEKITSKTKAIIPVHLNGRICDMDRILEIAKKHNLIVIEDSAQALGAEYKRKKGGSFGLAGCFSFYPAKILGAAGDGGAVTTDNPEITDKIRILRNHGQKTKTEIVDYGFTSRLHNLQAAILNVKLKYLDGWVERRREIAGIYNEGLKNIEGVKIPFIDGNGRKDAFQNYVLKAEKRNELFEFLKEREVETLVKDPVPNHWHEKLGLKDFKLPVTERLAKEVVSLPMYPELTDEQIQYIVERVREFYR